LRPEVNARQRDAPSGAIGVWDIVLAMARTHDELSSAEADDDISESVSNEPRSSGILNTLFSRGDDGGKLSGAVPMCGHDELEAMI
jgi:hypothetical protein